ncbi:hypothetical protein WME89_22105 [Sorangium sp. So ce321]|uniref:hypothetical protein n=1 Tax=Sorangium sp. So ce321 TaxID=3133300 RepID=UPI003F6000CB
MPTDLGPDVCSRLVREKHAFLNLFDACFTYDPSLLQMVTRTIDSSPRLSTPDP